jgi:hypothetical protein
MPTEQRYIPDQRGAPTKPVSRYSLRGRRKKARRAGEDKDYYVDWYEPRYFVLISLILILCVLDAYLTLKILAFGGSELNLLMLFLMEKKPILAMVIKYVATAVCVGIILIHKNFIVFGKLKVYYLIYVVFFVYFILVTYEAAFFFKHIWAYHPLS